MATNRKKTEKYNSIVPIEDYEHQGAKRTNNPPAGLAHLDRDETPLREFKYDPHLDPQLVWTGKAERNEVLVPAPSIHVHEELSAQKIIGSLRRQRLQTSLFDIDSLDPDKAVEFYRHDLDWSNRMILGDSLVVMNSLVERERMAGTAQVIFMDPPYGIKYQSNFQPGIDKRAVKDKNDQDLTREPEMIQAYRDTWELGIHSYLTYLRDRLVVSRELLKDSGSIFIQIGEENVHRVRVLLDEVFGAENYCSQITFATTSSAGSPSELKIIPATTNYLIWYAKNKSAMKYRQLYLPKSETRSVDTMYSNLELADGTRRKLSKEEKEDPSCIPSDARIFRIDNLTSQTGADTTTFPVEINGKVFKPNRGGWKTNQEGMNRLLESNRVYPMATSLGYVRYLDDFSGSPLSNLWGDTSGGSADKRYVVQTNPKVIARCILMASDPGDLVIDPTCGSGTTAFVSEQFGRRWITVDTSRVALSIARERLLTSVYPYYELRDQSLDVDGGFVYDELSRTTLRSIARGEGPETVTLFDQPRVNKSKTRVTGPFTFESISRYSANPSDEAPGSISVTAQSLDHIETLIEALHVMGIPRPGRKPLKINMLTKLSTIGSLQAEGIFDNDGKEAKFAVSIGPQFGSITMSQVSDSIRQAIGYDLLVFAGFAVTADAQVKLGSGKFGSMDVALLLANPDLLVGDLLKNTKSSQTFRLYASPDVKIEKQGNELLVTVEGVDSFDASTGEVTSFGKSGIQAWFLDADYDETVFRVSQAFFPVTNAWEKISKTLRGTADEETIRSLHTWTSLPFETGESGKVAIRIIGDDGNSSEVVLDVKKVK